MSSFLALINEPILNNAISLSVLQDMLNVITQDTYNEVIQIIDSIFFLTKQNPLSQMVHLLFVSAEFRVLKVPFYVKLLADIIKSHEDQKEEIKCRLLHSFTQPAMIHGPRCFFLRSLMNNGGIISENEIVNECHRFYLMRPSNPERLMTSFCWFAPEIEKYNQNLFRAVLASIYKNREMGMIHPMFVNFLNIYEPLRANDWKIYKDCVQYGFNPDRLVITISRDEVDLLKSEFSSPDRKLDPNYYIPECIFDCTHMLNLKPTLLHVAAFFGSIKCFSYLLTVPGIDPKLTADRRVSLLAFAVAGGNSEVIEKVLKIIVVDNSDFADVFETTAKFHQNGLFDFLLERIGKLTRSNQCGIIDPDQVYSGIINECASSNNISLLLKCIENGIDINQTDRTNVYIFFKFFFF